jgi:hypothetical protein
MSELDEIFNDEPQPETEVTESEESTGEETIDSTEEETENAESKTEEPKQESTPDPGDDEKSNWQFEAYKDEKRKRQEYEQKLKELQEKKEPEKAPDVLEDQEAFTSHIQSYVDQTVMNTRANMSQFLAEREFGKDVVTEKLETFKSLLADDPSLQSRVLGSMSPYHEIVDIVNKAERLKQLDNVEDIEAKIRAEIEEKVRAEYEQKNSEKTAKRESVTPSLNTRASSSKDSQPDDSLEAILSGR